MLAEIYAASSDVDVKRQILRAYMVSGDRARVLSAATSEPLPELREEAVRQLGVMGAREELWQLYQKESDRRREAADPQALFVGGDATRLIELANTETERRSAPHRGPHLGTMGAAQTGERWSRSIRRRRTRRSSAPSINALFVQSNAESLVAIARKETDPEAKRRTWCRSCR